MARIKHFAALTVLGASLAACAQTDPELASKHNPTIYSIHQPVVQRTDYVLDLASGGGGLPSSEAGRLQGWFDSLGLSYGDRIYIDHGNGYADSAARAEVARIAGNYGLLLSDGAPVTPGSVQPGALRVVVSRMSAGVPGCPDWSYSALPGTPISTDSNYGCAVNSNLAAMVADPNDLVLGQAGASAGDAATATKAIRQYRDAAPTGSKGLKAETASGDSK